MAITPLTVTIDLNPSYKKIPAVYVSQLDNNLRSLAITVQDGGVNYDVASSGYDVYVEGTKPDKHGFSYKVTDIGGTVAGSVVTVPMQTQMTCVQGMVPTEIVLKSGSDRIGSANFLLVVERAGLAEDVDVSETDIPAYIDGAQQAAAEATQAKDDAVSAKDTAVSAAETAQTVLDSIPADYSDLSDTVDDLLSALSEIGQVAVNLFDSSAAVDGYRIYTDGTNIQAADYFVSDYIPVEAGKTYVKNSPIADPYHRYALYNQYKTFLSVGNDNTFTASENGFVRICGLITEKATTTLYDSSVTVTTAFDYVARTEISNVETDVTDLKNAVYEYVTDEDVTIQNGFIDPSSRTFYSNASYQSANVTVGTEKHYHIRGYIRAANQWSAYYYYDSNNNMIGSGSIVSDSVYDDYITVPDNAAYFIVNSYSANTPLTVEIRRAKTDKILLTDKKFIVLGDSIMAQNLTINQFVSVTGADKISNVAVAGATLTDFSDTVLNGTDFTGHNNTVSQQVTLLLNTPPSETPDFFIVSAMTNDNLTVEELKSTSVPAFINSSNQYIDVETVDRATVDGAMRWIAEKLWSIAPNASIFFCSPIQAAQEVRASWNIILKQQRMICVANYLACPVVKAGTESGIYGRYETNGANGKYLIDGLHPNANGGVKLGNYYSAEIMKYYGVAK